MGEYSNGNSILLWAMQFGWVRQLVVASRACFQSTSGAGSIGPGSRVQANGYNQSLVLGDVRPCTVAFSPFQQRNSSKCGEPIQPQPQTSTSPAMIATWSYERSTNRCSRTGMPTYYRYGCMRKGFYCILQLLLFQLKKALCA